MENMNIIKLRVSEMWLDEQIVDSGKFEELPKTDYEEYIWMLKIGDRKVVAWRMDYGEWIIIWDKTQKVTLRMSD